MERGSEEGSQPPSQLVKGKEEDGSREAVERESREGRHGW